MGQIVLQGAGANTGQTLLAWCLDVFTYLQNSGTYQISPLTTAGSGGSNPPLTNMQISQIGSLMVNGNALIKTSSDTNVSAAIQLAIWLTEYGNNFRVQECFVSSLDSRSSVPELCPGWGTMVLPELHSHAAYFEWGSELGLRLRSATSRSSATFCKRPGWSRSTSLAQKAKEYHSRERRLIKRRD